MLTSKALPTSTSNRHRARAEAGCADGSLHKYIEIPASYRSAIVARIKIMCDLDIAEKRQPQDGKIQFKKFARSTSSYGSQRYLRRAASRMW